MVRAEAQRTVLFFRPNSTFWIKSPEELAEAGFVVCPDSLPKDWGPDAPEKYLQKLGILQTGHAYEYLPKSSTSSRQ